MKEDTLTQIKNEVEITKLNIEKNNEMVKRIKELEKNRYVREYLSLVGLSNTKQKFITDTDDEIISQMIGLVMMMIEQTIGYIKIWNNLLQLLLILRIVRLLKKIILLLILTVILKVENTTKYKKNSLLLQLRRDKKPLEGGF